MKTLGLLICLFAASFVFASFEAPVTKSDYVCAVEQGQSFSYRLVGDEEEVAQSDDERKKQEEDEIDHTEV